MQTGRRDSPYIGGATPSLPTVTRPAASLPSAFFVAPNITGAPGFRSAPLRWCEGHDRHTGRNDDLVAAALERQAELASGRRLHSAVDGAVGHHAAGLEVPRVVTLTGAAHRLGEHQHLERLQLAISAGSRGDADIGVRLDVGEVELLHRRHRQRVVQQDLDLRPLARVDSQGMALQRGDGAADPGGRRVLCDGGGRAQTGGQRERHQTCKHYSLPYFLLGLSAEDGMIRISGRGRPSDGRR